MHYKIGDHLIRSELAAKSVHESHHWVLDWISKLPRGAQALDYGCGKLRYTLPLAKRVRKVVAIDSSHQLHKLQTVCGHKTTVHKYVTDKVRNAAIYCTEDLSWKNKRYDIAICTNVLSAIPCFKTRHKVLKTIAGVLKPTGKLLLTTQYRNSYFSARIQSKRTIKHLDGWISRSNGRTSFYGLISTDHLVRYCRVAGLRILNNGTNDQSAYVLATPDKCKAHRKAKPMQYRGRSG